MARRRKEKRKKILLVDDNHETLEIISHLIQLRDDRIDVVSSPSAEEGLLELSGTNVLITDLRLPGMGGVDFIKRARRRNKDLPAIIISGLDESDIKPQIEGMEIVAFVPKPYKPDDLIQTILEAVWGDDAPPPVDNSKAQKDDDVRLPKSPRSDVFHPPLSAQTVSRLEQLQSGTMAHQVILWALDGTLLYVFNENERRAAEKTGKLAISSVASGLEMLVRSGSTPTQLMHVLDGDPYEIILGYVKSKGDYCLAIVLDGGAKLGTVWGAMQRTVADLAIRLNPDSNQAAEPESPSSEPVVAGEAATISPPKSDPEPEPVIESNPIASDEDLEKLIDDLLDDEVSEGELDDLWGADPTAPSAMSATEETPAAESVPEEPTESPAPVIEAEPPVEATDIPGLEGLLADTHEGELVDERWEEVKGMLGLDGDADAFWEQAIAEDLEAANTGQSQNKSGIMSYEEALKKGLLSDQESN